MYDSDTIGRAAIRLAPVDHDCLGRTYFRIHGDSRSRPGQASKGCIILNREKREAIADSDDKILKVIE